MRARMGLYSLLFVAGTQPRELCQHCVTYPPKPWANIMICADTATRIDVCGKSLIASVLVGIRVRLAQVVRKVTGYTRHTDGTRVWFPT